MDGIVSYRIVVIVPQRHRRRLLMRCEIIVNRTTKTGLSLLLSPECRLKVIAYVCCLLIFIIPIGCGLAPGCSRKRFHFVYKMADVKTLVRDFSRVIITLDNILIPEEKLSATPSILDGLNSETETDLRILGCELIQTSGILLKLPQVCIANMAAVNVRTKGVGLLRRFGVVPVVSNHQALERNLIANFDYDWMASC